MQNDVEAGLRSGVGAGLGGLLGAAIGMGPGRLGLLKKFGITGNPLQQSLAGGTMGMAIGGGIGDSIAAPNAETLVGSGLGGGLGTLAGHAAMMPQLKVNPTKSGLLRYLLGMGVGGASGSAVGGGIAHATGVTPALKSLFGSEVNHDG